MKMGLMPLRLREPQASVCYGVSSASLREGLTFKMRINWYCQSPLHLPVGRRGDSDKGNILTLVSGRIFIESILVMTSKKIRFNAPLDNLGKVVTVAVTILFSIICLFQLGVFSGTAPELNSIIVVIALLVIYFGVYSFRPVNYLLFDEELIIRRPVSNIVINRIDIVNIRILDPKELDWTFRTWGVGGFFGYYGKFSNTNLGNMTWYVTNRNLPILIETTDNRKIVISPENPTVFLLNFS
jgi:hypothetical protein